MKFGRLLARLFIGGMFIGHGTQKLFGWFGGPGIEGTTGMMDSLGLAPARQNAYAASLPETLGGVGIALGAFTPAAAASLIGTMTTAIRTVHLKNGFWSSGGGYEYNLVLLAAVFGLTENGPGQWSIDGALGRSRWGTRWALAALAAGAAGSAAVLRAAKQEVEKDTERPAAEAEPVTAAS